MFAKPNQHSSYYFFYDVGSEKRTEGFSIDGENTIQLERSLGSLRAGVSYSVNEILGYVSQLLKELEDFHENLDEYYTPVKEMTRIGMRDSDFF